MQPGKGMLSTTVGAILACFTVSAAASGESLTDEELRSFASAYLQVEQVRQNRLEELQGTSGNPQQVKQVQREVYEETVQAIEQTGLSVEEYNEIGVTVQKDEDVREQVIEIIQEQ